MKTTTWDGLPTSTVPPFGTAVVVYRLGKSAKAVEILLLHRAHKGPDYGGDWAWTPPTGCRFPGEAIRDCASRELFEECGLSLAIDFSENFGDDEWRMYCAEAESSMPVRLIDPEHDAFEWVSADEAVRRCEPAIIKLPLAKAVDAVARLGRRA